jgi:hypothetical protein
MMKDNFSDPQSIKNVLLTVRSLLNKRLFSPIPENVVIERVGKEPIYPCGRGGPEGLDLNQLEWAAREGRFWFSGPIRVVKIIFDKGSMQGDLEIALEKLKFVTSLSTLNYRNFDRVAERLTREARQLNLELDFEPLPNYLIKLEIKNYVSFSANTVNDFVDKLNILYQSTDEL